MLKKLNVTVHWNIFKSKKSLLLKYKYSFHWFNGSPYRFKVKNPTFMATYVGSNYISLFCSKFRTLKYLSHCQTASSDRKKIKCTFYDFVFCNFWIAIARFVFCCLRGLLCNCNQTGCNNKILGVFSLICYSWWLSLALQFLEFSHNIYQSQCEKKTITLYAVKDVLKKQGNSVYILL